MSNNSGPLASVGVQVLNDAAESGRDLLQFESTAFAAASVIDSVLLWYKTRFTIIYADFEGGHV